MAHKVPRHGKAFDYTLYYIHIFIYYIPLTVSPSTKTISWQLLFVTGYGCRQAFTRIYNFLQYYFLCNIYKVCRTEDEISLTETMFFERGNYISSFLMISNGLCLFYVFRLAFDIFISVIALLHHTIRETFIIIKCNQAFTMNRLISNSNQNWMHKRCEGDWTLCMQSSLGA